LYSFDTSSLRELQHFYPAVFKSVWSGIDELAAQSQLISTREVLAELLNQSASDHVKNWAKANKHIFLTPTTAELQFVATIFQVQHFQTLIGKQQQLTGRPVADPFIIANARYYGSTVVTQEKLKVGAAKIPNVCAHFQISCMSLEDFMKEQGWSF